MANENQFIRVELRYWGEDELKLIQEELSITGTIPIAEYDGMVEVEVPLSSLEILKQKHILMDFPSKQKLVINDDLVLLNEDSAGTIAEMNTESKSKMSTKSFPIAEEGVYIVNFKSPLSSVLRSNFNKEDIQLSSFFENENEYSYKAFLTKKQYEFLTKQDITSSINKFKSSKKGHLPTNSGFKINISLKKYEIVLSDERYFEEVEKTIRSSEQATIVDTWLNMIRIEANPESALINTLTESPYISSFMPYEPPTLYCDVCRKVIGLEYSSTNTTPFLGEAEVVGVIDSGIDEMHPDLKNRIKVALQYGMGIQHDLAGHGTHVAGIICGDGTASNGKIIGIAPKAQVVSIGIVNNVGQLDLPIDIGKLLKIAVDNGAKIINLSLGRKVSGEYQFGSLSVDKFIYENPEILVVVAAGNDGNAVNGNLAYKTVGAPATAKNALTVGSTTGRRNIPVIGQTWGDRKPANFPIPPLNTIKLISYVDYPSIGSSTGPTDFDSIKPEVVAPGTYILSAKASASNISATGSEFFDNNYTFKTGTSMATPVVSGIAALVREYLRTVHNCLNPSSSLIKAIIIGSSHKIESYRKAPDDPSLDKIGFPDFDQGFGLVDLNKLLNEKTTALHFADIFSSNSKALVSRAELGGVIKSSREYMITITDNTDLSVTLTWIDPPARGIQNNLQLSVKLPSNEWRVGNMDHNYKKDELFDTLFNLKPLDKYNNTEKVLITNPMPGKYLIRVTAQNTLSPQGYSLAIISNGSEFAER